MNIGEYITQERTSRGWSMGDLARRSGVTKAHISKIERHETDVSLGKLQLLAKAFDMAVGDMLVDAGYTLQEDRRTK